MILHRSQEGSKYLKRQIESGKELMKEQHLLNQSMLAIVTMKAHLTISTQRYKSIFPNK